MTINSVEEGILASMLLEDNTLYSMAEKNSFDELTLEFKLEPLEIAAEQTTDQDNAETIRWIEQKIKPNTTYSAYDSQRYHKQMNRIVLVNRVLYRKFLDHTGKVVAK